MKHHLSFLFGMHNAYLKMLKHTRRHTQQNKSDFKCILNANTTDVSEYFEFHGNDIKK